MRFEATRNRRKIENPRSPEVAASKKSSCQKRSAMDERQFFLNNWTFALTSHKIRETTEVHCILPQQVLRARSWRSISASLWGRVLWPPSSCSNGARVSSTVSSSLLEMENFGFCTKAISSTLKSSKPFSATLTVWQITLGRRRILRLLVRGFEHPNAPSWHPVHRQWNEHADGVRHCERAVPTAASRRVLAVGRGAQLAHKVQFQVSSTLQAGIDSTGLDVDRMLLRR